MPRGEVSPPQGGATGAIPRPYTSSPSYSGPNHLEHEDSSSLDSVPGALAAGPIVWTSNPAAWNQIESSSESPHRGGAAHPPSSPPSAVASPGFAGMVTPLSAVGPAHLRAGGRMAAGNDSALSTNNPLFTPGSGSSHWAGDDSPLHPTSSRLEGRFSERFDGSSEGGEDVESAVEAQGHPSPKAEAPLEAASPAVPSPPIIRGSPLIPGSSGISLRENALFVGGEAGGSGGASRLSRQVRSRAGALEGMSSSAAFDIFEEKAV